MWIRNKYIALLTLKVLFGGTDFASKTIDAKIM